MLAVEHVSRSFDGSPVVVDVSFTVAAGEVVALIGPNGAGKTTCFNMIGGQLRPDAGRIVLDGAALAAAPRAVWGRAVGRTFQVAAAFRSMTVCENVQVALTSRAGQTWRAWRRLGHEAAAQALLDEVGLGAQAGLAAGILAYGDLKRLDLALALSNDPRLLLMDEPAAGMAAAERAALMRLVRGLAKARNVAVLFTEHDMDTVFAIADRILVMNRGTLIAEGDGPAVRANKLVREAYLG